MKTMRYLRMALKQDDINQEWLKEADAAVLRTRHSLAAAVPNHMAGDYRPVCRKRGL